MDTIKVYVDNMFNNLARTSELKSLKEEILMNMEDKYLELKAEGKTENEAIGIVISEFGNLDEIIKEFNIEVEDEDLVKNIGLDEAREFLEDSKKCNFLISIGVMLCMFSGALLVLLFQLFEDGLAFKGFSEDKFAFIPIGIILVLVGIAVGIFIYSGLLMDKYSFIEKGEFKLSYDTKITLKKESQSLTKRVTYSTIVGVGLCIISPIAVFIGVSISGSAGVYGAAILILLVAIAVFIFINISADKDRYYKLLEMHEYSKIYKKGDKVIGAISSIVWPIAVVIFFVWGVMYDGWRISWIVFPIVGIVFGIFCSIYKAFKSIEEE